MDRNHKVRVIVKEPDDGKWEVFVLQKDGSLLAVIRMEDKDDGMCERRLVWN